MPSNLSFLMEKDLVKLINGQFSCCKIAGNDMTATLVDEKQKRFLPLVSFILLFFSQILRRHVVT